MPFYQRQYNRGDNDFAQVHVKFFKQIAIEYVPCLQISTLVKYLYVYLYCCHVPWYDLIASIKLKTCFGTQCQTDKKKYFISRLYNKGNVYVF